ncbi:MAG: HEPN domain-containing protein [Candidatus Undinarchaeales archaeon]
MKRNNFLNKMKAKGKLELVEPSEDISNSYLEKSENCLESARLLRDNNLYENSISMSYYSMYNSLTALLFRTGIKCENHSASILLLKLLFNKSNLFKSISDAKEERIDRQYYVTEEDKLTKEIVKELLKNAEEFVVKIRLLIKNLSNDSITKIRKKFEELTG